MYLVKKLKKYTYTAELSMSIKHEILTHDFNYP